MNINSKTKLKDILVQYPWLPDELIKMDSRAKVIKTPVGKMMIKNATVADAIKMTGYSEKELVIKLQELVQKHSNKL